MWNFSGDQIRWQQQIFPKWHARWFYNCSLGVREIESGTLGKQKKKCSVVGISLKSTTSRLEQA